MSSPRVAACAIQVERLSGSNRPTCDSDGDRFFRNDEEGRNLGGKGVRHRADGRKEYRRQDGWLAEEGGRSIIHRRAGFDYRICWREINL